MHALKTALVFSLRERVPAVVGLLLAVVSAGFAQNSLVPVVTVQATQVYATTNDPGKFTVFRKGDTNATLNVWYDLGGTASNGVDYAGIPPHWVTIPAGAISNTVAITPLISPSPANAAKTVVLTLTNSPLMTPVNYQIGMPSAAVVFIQATNPPLAVRIVSPASGAVFTAPATIPLVAKATDLGGSVTNVEFFANGSDLRPGLPVVLDPPGANGVTGLVYFFNWQNVPTNDYCLTAVAKDDGGLSITSAPVNIVVQMPPPNLPPAVRIISPPNGAVFHAPVNLPLYAYARANDFGVSALSEEVTNLEFYADGADIGAANHVAFGPPPPAPGEPMPEWVGLLPDRFVLLWSNAPVGSHQLIAVAEDQFGNAATSAPVNIKILPPLPPPTNCPAVISIVATDPVAVEGTNDWVWRGESNSPPSWSAWPPQPVCWFTNYGPKTATFAVRRYGDTHNNLTVAYAIGGTATNGIDYVALPGVITIPAGERRADITIVPLEDGPPDITSSVVLKLIPDVTGTNYLPGFPRAAAAIIIDRPSLTVATGLMPDGVFHLSEPGPDGAWFHVEYSTDLAHWTPICTNQVVNGSMDFVDPDAATDSTRFYRTVPDTGPTQ
ncbi:MAG TPA: Ig-like domain-containing protein [Verrucomicrobiae bacterium]|nr:Ig-like domain-containing protein [Verrucomicrobiae bacterium]